MTFHLSFVNHSRWDFVNTITVMILAWSLSLSLSLSLFFILVFFEYFFLISSFFFCPPLFLKDSCDLTTVRTSILNPISFRWFQLMSYNAVLLWKSFSQDSSPSFEQLLKLNFILFFSFCFSFYEFSFKRMILRHSEFLHNLLSIYEYAST